MLVKTRLLVTDDRRDVVDGRGELQRKDDRDRTGALDIGADIVRAGPAQRQEPAVRVERQLGADVLVAAVIIAEQRLGARRDPFDRPADAARSPDDDRLLGIDIALHAKAAADIAGDDADAAFRHVQDLMRQGLADAVHVLRAGVERVAAGAGIIIGNAAARLHRDGGEAVVEEREPRDVMRPGEGGARPHRHCPCAS